MLTDNALGTVSVENSGELRIGFVEKLSNLITGAGSLVKTGGGITHVTREAAGYTGDTLVEQGGLILGDDKNDVTLASAAVTVEKNGLFGGHGGQR